MTDLDLLPAADVARLVLDAERRVVPAVTRALPEIVRAAELLAAAWAQGGRWVFAGAGTSGRIAWSQAAELPGTFGLDRTRVLARVAGGVGGVDADEDDPAAAAADIGGLALATRDVVVAVAASGSTPYTLAVAEAARSAGAVVVAVVTRAGSPLAGVTTVAVEAVVGEEVLRGSTRLGAGTAQKLALDALTTTAAACLGRVHGDLMLDVEPANAKLRERAAGIVADIAGVRLDAARAALAECGSARAAVLSLVHGLPPADAAALAERHRTLRAALEEPGNVPFDP